MARAAAQEHERRDHEYDRHDLPAVHSSHTSQIIQATRMLSQWFAGTPRGTQEDVEATAFSDYPRCFSPRVANEAAEQDDDPPP